MAAARPHDPELDRLTLERARRGDRAAQAAFLRRYVRPLHALVSRAGLRGDADDLTQELMARLLAALPRFDPAGAATLTTWVFTVAQRWLIDEKRRRHLALVELDEGSEVADLRPGPDALLEGRQLWEALGAALQQLPEAQRRAFLLAEVHDQPLLDVAAGEGIPVGTLKSRLHRARAQLAQWLGPRLGLAPVSSKPGANHGAR